MEQKSLDVQINNLKKLLLVLTIIVAIPFLFIGCVQHTPEPEIILATTTITFDTGFDDIQMEAITAAVGEQIQPPEIPTKEGYQFIAWLKDGDIYNFDKMPETNIELVAYWKALSTITFDTGFDDIQIEAITTAVGEQIQPPEIPTKEGYQFIAWLKDGDIYNFDKMPETNIELDAYWLDTEYTENSSLPCMSINLFGDDGETYPLDLVNRDDYVDSKISISNTDEEYEIESVKASFKGRGNGSWYGAGGKNGYRIKFKDKQSLFGRELNKHWVIIACANFDDLTMYRNYLAYNMANEVFSNLEYTTNAEWIDVYINGIYHGVYLLCEHVRVDSGRVDIESEYGIKNTGYLIEYDCYATGEENIDYFKIEEVKYPFTVKSPDPADYSEKVSKEDYMSQVAYIKDYVQAVYDAALGHDFDTFSSLADVDSFVDMYIIHELFKNIDTGWSSFYMYKKPDGKLFAGPVWDFDATTNTSERGYRDPQGIYVAQEVMSASPDTASELYIELYKTQEFLEAVKLRWQAISSGIERFVNEKMSESVYSAHKVAMGRNFVLWKGKLQTDAENNWVEESRILKHWIRDRIDWLNYEWKSD